jgi:hypothetical protein
MTKIELQSLKNQIFLMQALHALSHMWSRDKADMIKQIVQPAIDGTMALIEDETK